MKMDKDALKKHHFWVGVAVVPLFILIALIGLFGGVAGAIGEREKEIKGAEDAVKAQSNPKTEKLLSELDKQKLHLFEQRKKLWDEAWKKQKDLYAFPSALADLDDKYFGDAVPVPLRQAFWTGDTYLNQFDEMAKTVTPTQFAGGPYAVLLPQEWVRAPSSEEVWLAMEDVWVKGELLKTVVAVNKEIGTFKPLTKDKPLERKFRSRIWELDLKVVTRGPDRFFQGTLKNLSERLQAVGLGNRMILEVWLRNDDLAEPVRLEVEAEFVAAGASVPVGLKGKQDPAVREYPLPRSVAAVELARVEQRFDSRTVPVKRIDALVLGYKSARHNAIPLKMSKASQTLAEKEKTDAETAAASGAGAAGAGGVGPMGAGPTGAAVGVTEGGGSTPVVAADQTPNNALTRGRYIQMTAQVRRMPIGLTLIVDQAFLPDVEVAFANSRLRFQNTQMHFQRFRGGLPNQGASPFAGGGPDAAPGAGSADSGPVRPMGPPRPGVGPVGPTGASPTSSPNYPGGGASYPGSYGSATGVTDDLLAANLVEMTLYGVASLYERYPPREPAEAKAADATAEPKIEAPGPKTDADKPEAKDKEKAGPKDKAEPREKDADKSAAEEKAEPREKAAPKGKADEKAEPKEKADG